MIVVVAPRLDAAAQALVASCAAGEADLLTAGDLTSPGWVFDVADPASATVVVGGHRVAMGDIDAIVTRRPAVIAEELTNIAGDDRDYVAAEANAFLSAWLTAAPCPVINRPTATSLCGPAWSPLQWALAAGRADVPWNAYDPIAADQETHDLVLCGSRVFGDQGAWEAPAVRRLARSAEVVLLGVRVCGASMCAASILPDLGAPEVREALLEMAASNDVRGLATGVRP